MKEKEKKELLKFTGLMGIGGILSKILSIPRSIVFAKFLMPSGYGVLQILKVIISYFGYAQMGILQAMNRNVPRAYANNEFDKAKKIKDLSFTWLSFVSILALVILWIVYFFKEDFNKEVSLVNMILLTITIILSQLNSFVKPLLKAEGKFIVLGKVLLFKSGILPFIGMALVYFFNLTGAIVALVIDQLFTLIASLVLYREYIPKLYFSFKLLIEQASKGFLIFLNRFSETIVSSLAILLIGVYYSAAEVGVFSFGMVSLLSVQRYSAPIRIYIYRDIMKMKGSEDKNNEYYKKLFKLPHLFNLLLNTVLLGIFAITYFTIINIFLPKYTESVPVIYISVFGLVVYNARDFFGQFLDATNQLVIRTVFIFIGAATGVALTFIFLIYKMPLYYMAISCGIGFLLISTFMIFYAYKQVTSSYTETFVMIGKILLIAGINTYVVYLFSEFNFVLYPNDKASFMKIMYSIIDLLIKGGVILIINYLIFGLLFMKLNLFREMKKIAIFVLKKTKIIKTK